MWCSPFQPHVPLKLCILFIILMARTVFSFKRNILRFKRLAKYDQYSQHLHLLALHLFNVDALTHTLYLHEMLRKWNHRYSSVAMFYMHSETCISWRKPIGAHSTSLENFKAFFPLENYWSVANRLDYVFQMPNLRIWKSFGGYWSWNWIIHRVVANENPRIHLIDCRLKAAKKELAALKRNLSNWKSVFPFL